MNRSTPLLSRTQRLDCDWRDWMSRFAAKQKQRSTVKIWNTLRTTYKVSDFIQWQRDGALILNPDFQRRSVWKAGAKSYLIDTIIRGLPIPIIFLRDLKSDLQTFSPRRDVIDGQQRLRTVIAFVAPDLLGKDFDPSRDVFKISKAHNEEFQGCDFRSLPKDLQHVILDYQFSVNVFASDTDDREVKQVFARMNSSGYKLNPQELRNAEWFGLFKTLAETLGTEQLNRWRAWKVFTADDLARMKEVELSSELMIMMLHGISEKDDKVISGAYKSYDETFDDREEVARRFRGIFEFIDDRLTGAAMSYFSKRSLFYALFAAIYDVQYGLQKLPASGKRMPLRRAKASPVSDSQLNTIVKAGSKIADKTAPPSVVESTIRRIHVTERRALTHYLLTLK